MSELFMECVEEELEPWQKPAPEVHLIDDDDDEPIFVGVLCMLLHIFKYISVYYITYILLMFKLHTHKSLFNHNVRIPLCCLIL